MRRGLSSPRRRLPRAARRKRCRPRKRAGAFVTASCADRRKPPLGRYKEAAASFLQAAGASELEAAALENSAVCALLAGIPEAENEAMRRLIKRSDFAPTVERIRFFEAMRQAAKRSPQRSGSSSQDSRQRVRIRATREAGSCRMGLFGVLRARTQMPNCAAFPQTIPPRRKEPITLRFSRRHGRPRIRGPGRQTCRSLSSAISGLAVRSAGANEIGGDVLPAGRLSRCQGPVRHRRREILGLAAG